MKTKTKTPDQIAASAETKIARSRERCQFRIDGHLPCAVRVAVLKGQEPACPVCAKWIPQVAASRGIVPIDQEASSHA